MNDNRSESPETVAKELAELVTTKGQHDNWVPFSDRALKQGAIKEKRGWYGGKMDDIALSLLMLIKTS